MKIKQEAIKTKLPKIHIIGGKGKMGQWFTHIFKEHGIPVTVSGREYLKEKHTIHSADIIMVSVPISQTESVITNLLPLIKPTSLLTDVTSVKIIPLQAMESASCGTLGMHPLFGPTIGSVIGQKVIFCRQKNNTHVTFLKNFFQTIGIEVIEMSAEEHDYQVAYIQALTHATHLLFAKTLLGQDKEILTKLQTPTFALHAFTMGRVLSQDIDLMADIQLYNPYFPPVYDSLFENAKLLLESIKKGDKTSFTTLFQNELHKAKQFSNLSLFQTNKILGIIAEIPVHVPIEKPHIEKNQGKNIFVAFLGPQGTYSGQAAKHVFPQASYIPTESIYGTFQAVLQNKAQYGIVPAENSLEGVVRNTLDYLVEFSLALCGSYAMPIHHQLLSKEKALSDIHTVVSHPQALGQCKKWMQEKLPHVTVLPTESTTQALTTVKKGYGYIASAYASTLYNIPILAQNIEDILSNTTRFYVIAKNPVALKGLSDSRTLIFVTVYNRVGILRDVLDVLAKHDLNLLKLESRPSQEKVWDYHFFIEIEKEEDNPKLKNALKELEIHCPMIRILGKT